MSLKEYIQNNKAIFDDQKMASQADTVFEKRLQSVLHSPSKKRIVYLKYMAIAAGIGLLLTLGVKSLYNAKIANDKIALLENLEDDSAGMRLEGIYHFSDVFTKEDDQIINTLIKILHRDSNVNVKIATIDALLKFSDNENIRSNLLIALEKEKQPMVQIKLIKSLGVLREHRAQKLLEKLIKNNETFPIVKSNATLAMAKLKH